MGKSNRRNKKGIRFYFNENGSKTIRTIYAESEEEARLKVAVMLGHEDFRLRQLPHVQSKEETRRIKQLSEDIAGELIGPSAKKVMKTLHEM